MTSYATETFVDQDPHDLFIPEDDATPHSALADPPTAVASQPIPRPPAPAWIERPERPAAIARPPESRSFTWEPVEAAPSRLILPPGVRSVRPQTLPAVGPAAAPRSRPRAGAPTWPLQAGPPPRDQDRPERQPSDVAGPPTGPESAPASGTITANQDVHRPAREDRRVPGAGIPVGHVNGRMIYLPDDPEDPDYDLSEGASRDRERLDDDDDQGWSDDSFIPEWSRPNASPARTHPASEALASRVHRIDPGRESMQGPWDGEEDNTPGARSGHNPAPLERLTSSTVVRRRPTPPDSGWRRTAFQVSGGRWTPRPGPADMARTRLEERIRVRIRGAHQIASIGGKGGVGKTTVTAGLGLTYARFRPDRVLALDANPDLGTLADRLTGEVGTTLQHLLDELSADPALPINRLEQFVSEADRLHVLAGNQDPCNGGLPFTRDEYEELMAVLLRCYNIVITDSGTAFDHPALSGTLVTADSVVVVGAPTVDAASRASLTLDWLRGNGCSDLADDAVVVMCRDTRSREIDHDVIRAHFAPPRCRALVSIPTDPHLETGGLIAWDNCRPETREAFCELAATVADSFRATARNEPIGHGLPELRGAHR